MPTIYACLTVHTLRRASAINSALAYGSDDAWCRTQNFMKEKKKNIVLLEDNATDKERKKRELDALMFGELVFRQFDCPKGYFTLKDLDGLACQQISTSKIPF